MVAIAIELVGTRLAKGEDIVSASQKNSQLLSEAGDLETHGRFKEAAAMLTKALGNTELSGSNRKMVEFELDRLNRIKYDFSLSRTQLYEKLKASVAELTNEEFEKWLKEGRFDRRVIDGEELFPTTSVSNLFFRYQELNPRRRPPKDMAGIARRYWESCTAIKKAAAEQKSPYVLPSDFKPR